jgi:hypothetical protein
MIWLWPLVFLVLGGAVAGWKDAMPEIDREGWSKNARSTFIGGAFPGAIMFAVVGCTVAQLQHQTRAACLATIPAALFIAGCSIVCLFGLQRMGHWSILAGGLGGAGIIRAKRHFFRGNG